MDKRGFNMELNQLKDKYPDKLVLIEGIQRAFNRDVPSISRENLLALYQNPAQFMLKKNLADGLWTTQLHEWADNGVEDLLKINPIYLGAKNAYGDTVLMNMVEYAIGKTTEQINFAFLKKLLENPMVFEYKTSEDGELCKASVWDIKDITGRTPIDYLSDMASGTGTCEGCEPITELAPMIAEWASIMQDALPEEYADVPEVAEQYVEEQPPTEEEVLDAISEYDLCDGECEPCDGEDDVVEAPVEGEPNPEEGEMGESMEGDGLDDNLPEEAKAMIHEEVGKDSFIRDKGNVERIALAKSNVITEGITDSILTDPLTFLSAPASAWLVCKLYKNIVGSIFKTLFGNKDENEHVLDVIRQIETNKDQFRSQLIEELKHITSHDVEQMSYNELYELFTKMLEKSTATDNGVPLLHEVLRVRKGVKPHTDNNGNSFVFLGDMEEVGKPSEYEDNPSANRVHIYKTRSVDAIRTVPSIMIRLFIALVQNNDARVNYYLGQLQILSTWSGRWRRTMDDVINNVKEDVWFSPNKIDDTCKPSQLAKDYAYKKNPTRLPWNEWDNVFTDDENNRRNDFSYRGKSVHLD